MRGRILIAATLLSACGAGPDKAELDRIRQATAAVRAQMMHPESAQFKEVAVHGDAVCGQVNGSVGVGMVGYERFIVKGRQVTTESSLPTQSAMEARWAADCGG